MHIHLAEQGNAPDWNVMIGPSLSPLGSGSLNLTSLRCLEGEISPKRHRPNERPFVKTANLIHNFLPCVMVACHLISLSLGLSRALWPLQGHSCSMAAVSVRLVTRHHDLRSLTVFFFWTNGNSELFKGSEAKNVSA